MFDTQDRQLILPPSLPLPPSLIYIQVFVAEVKSHEDQIDAVKAKGRVLKSQGSTEDKKMVDRWVGDLLKRYDDLNFTLDEKQVSRLVELGSLVGLDS